MDDLKRAASYSAAEAVCSGMVVGLGSGSTARYATLRIAQKLREGGLHDIVAIPTSERTASLARHEGIPLGMLQNYAHIDVTIDGADEVDPELNVIKGLGGYLLREKIVASATLREIVVVDDSKLVERLGTKGPVPVEVIPFGLRHTQAALARTGAVTELRTGDGAPFVTDEGNYILDCSYDAITSQAELAVTLNAIPGVVEHGLFLGMVHAVFVASQKGVRVLER